MLSFFAMAKPAPEVGKALGSDGDSYVRSLAIEVFADDGERVTVGGYSFEDLMSVIGLHHVAFQPRTRAIRENSVKAENLLRRIDANWSSIDTLGAPVISVASNLQTLAKGATTISWRQVN